jgi:hypothetical protein
MFRIIGEWISIAKLTDRAKFEALTKVIGSKAVELPPTRVSTSQMVLGWRFKMIYCWMTR